MPTTYFTSNEYRGCSPGDCCARERGRLLLLQKRLELQKERFDLDRQILEAEKISFKRSVKLAAKRKNRSLVADKSGTERTRKQFQEQQDEIENLRVQLKVFQKKEECRDRREKSTTGIGSVDFSSEEQSQKIQKLEKDLREVKREHKSLKKKHQLEKEKWANEILELVKNESISDAVDCALKEEVERVGLLLENSKEENKGLREESIRLKRSSESLLKMTSTDELETDLVDTDALAKLAERFKVLLEERDTLEIQLRDQSRQIDDWKLLLPRNKVLLDHTLSKNKELMKELEDSRTRNQKEMSDSKIESRLQMKAQQTGQEYDKSEEFLMDDMNTVCLDYIPSNKKDSSTTTISPSNVEKTFLIPSDFLEEINKHDKKFVIEWEWVNGETGFGGLFTGWLDLEGNPDGSGTLRIDDGGIYIGGWEKGLRNGNGVYTSIDGAIYSGPWLSDRFQGRGIFVSETNQVYTGDWNNGLRHGSGIETWANGACYTGHYHFDKRNENQSRSDDDTSFDGIHKNQADNNSRKTPFYDSVSQEDKWVMGKFIGS